MTQAVKVSAGQSVTMEFQDWKGEEHALFATVYLAKAGVLVHLVVERFPDSRYWDWTVWQHGKTPEIVWYGHAASATIAMVMAQQAAKYET